MKNNKLLIDDKSVNLTINEIIEMYKITSNIHLSMISIIKCLIHEELDIREKTI